MPQSKGPSLDSLLPYGKSTLLLRLRCSYCKQACSQPKRARYPLALTHQTAISCDGPFRITYSSHSLEDPNGFCSLCIFIFLSFFLSFFCPRKLGNEELIRGTSMMFSVCRAPSKSIAGKMRGSENLLTCLSVYLSEVLLIAALHFRPASPKKRKMIIRTENPNPACVIPKISYRRFLVLDESFLKDFKG